MTDDVVDYTDTATARRNRAEKAQALAAYGWRHDLEPEDLIALSPEKGRAFARGAGVAPPSTSQTWHFAAARLEVMRTAAADAIRRRFAPEQDLIEHADQWRRPVEQTLAESAAVEPEPEPGDALPGAVIPDDAPRGWAELAACGPVPSGARCHACRRPAITATLNLWRCPEHPPRKGEWGWALNHTPLEQATCAPGRCYCARCTTFDLPTLPPPPSDTGRSNRR